MAETNKVVIEAEVKGAGNVQQSFADIKKEIKSLQGAALNGDGKAAKRIAELKDKMEDLGDSVKSLKGSGVEKIGSSFGLLGQGFKSLDLDKIKTGFKGVGAAMSAIPIFLIAEGVSYLVENWNELTEGTGILAKVLRPIGDLFTWLTDLVYDFTDAIGLTNSELDKQGDAIKSNSEKVSEALNEQIADYDRQMKVAKAAGKSTVEIEQAKQQAIIDTNLVIARQIEAFVRAGGELDEEKKKLLTASLNAIKNAKVEEYVIEQTDTNRKKEEYKKKSDDKKKALEDDFKAALDEQQKQEDLRTKSIQAQRDAEIKQEADRAALRKQMREQENAEQIKAEQEKGARMEAEVKTEADIRAKQIDASIKATQDLASITQSIADIGFAAKLARVKKGSAEETAIMKKQFEVNKKVQIAQTAISGATAAVEAYKGLAGIPVIGVGLGIAAAAAVGLSTAAAIQKIKATTFDSGGGGDVNVASPTASGGGGASTPTTQAPTTQAQPFTRLDEGGNNITVKAYVVESEMTDSQKRVGRLKEQASF